MHFNFYFIRWQREYKIYTFMLSQKVYIKVERIKGWLKYQIKKTVNDSLPKNFRRYINT